LSFWLQLYKVREVQLYALCISKVDFRLPTFLIDNVVSVYNIITNLTECLEVKTLQNKLNQNVKTFGFGGWCGDWVVIKELAMMMGGICVGYMYRTEWIKALWVMTGRKSVCYGTAGVEEQGTRNVCVVNRRVNQRPVCVCARVKMFALCACVHQSYQL